MPVQFPAVKSGIRGSFICCGSVFVRYTCEYAQCIRNVLASFQPTCKHTLPLQVWRFFEVPLRQVVKKRGFINSRCSPVWQSRDHMPYRATAQDRSTTLAAALSATTKMGSPECTNEKVPPAKVTFSSLPPLSSELSWSFYSPIVVETREQLSLSPCHCSRGRHTVVPKHHNVIQKDI